MDGLSIRAAQNFWGLNFQWPSLSFAQILNVYQVLVSLGQRFTTLPEARRLIAYLLKWLQEGVFQLLATWLNIGLGTQNLVYIQDWGQTQG